MGKKKEPLTPDGRIQDLEGLLKDLLCSCGVAIDCCYGALVLVDKTTGEDMYYFSEGGVLVGYSKINIPVGYKK